MRKAVRATASGAVGEPEQDQRAADCRRVASPALVDLLCTWAYSPPKSCGLKSTEDVASTDKIIKSMVHEAVGVEADSVHVFMQYSGVDEYGFMVGEGKHTVTVGRGFLGISALPMGVRRVARLWSMLGGADVLRGTAPQASAQ